MEIVEIYKAPQGEGPNIGTPSIFVRLQGCPVGCSWCDTKYTWPMKSSESATRTPGEIASAIRTLADLEIQHVVITGGEPMMQRKELERLVHILEQDFHVEIETSGVYKPLLNCNPHYNVSPKMPSAKAKILPSDILTQYISEDSVFKFVISSEEDFTSAWKLSNKYNLPYERIYLMPEGITSEDIKKNMRLLETLIMGLWPQVKMTTRLHILMHEQERFT